MTDCPYPAIHSPKSMRSVSLRFMERDGGGGRRTNLRLAELNRSAATTSIDITTMIIDHGTTAAPIGNEMILVQKTRSSDLRSVESILSTILESFALITYL